LDEKFGLDNSKPGWLDRFARGVVPKATNEPTHTLANPSRLSRFNAAVTKGGAKVHDVIHTVGSALSKGKDVLSRKGRDVALRVGTGTASGNNKVSREIKRGIQRAAASTGSAITRHNVGNTISHDYLGGKEAFKSARAHTLADKAFKAAGKKGAKDSLVKKATAFAGDQRLKGHGYAALGKAKKYGIPAAGIAAAAYGVNKYMKHREKTAKQASQYESLATTHFNNLKESLMQSRRLYEFSNESAAKAAVGPQGQPVKVKPKGAKPASGKRTFVPVSTSRGRRTGNKPVQSFGDALAKSGHALNNGKDALAKAKPSTKSGVVSSSSAKKDLIGAVKSSRKSYKEKGFLGKAKHNILGGREASKAEIALKKAAVIKDKLKGATGEKAVKLGAHHKSALSKAKWQSRLGKGKKYGAAAAGVAAVGYGVHKVRKAKARKAAQRHMVRQEMFLEPNYRHQLQETLFNSIVY